MNQIPPQPNRSDGIPFPVVVTGALIVLGLLIIPIYFIFTQLEQSGSADSVSSVFEQANNTVRAIVNQNTQSNPIDKLTPETSQATTPSTTSEDPDNKKKLAGAGTPQTYDIGAYLTYGAKASLLDRAIAKLSSDNMRLIVGLYEATQGPKEKPALGIIFEFKKARNSCSLENVKELTLLFNLKAMGDISAQTTELSLKTERELQGSLEQFDCSLKKGGRLDLQLLGANSNIIKPPGSTFAWGVRLAQEIG